MAWRETARKITILAGIILALPLGIAVLVNAHNIEVFAYREGGRVFVTGDYGGGTKAGKAKVEVLDSAGRKVMDGITDPEGVFSFVIPVEGDLQIIVMDDMGHRNFFILKGETDRSHSGENNMRKLMEQYSFRDMAVWLVSIVGLAGLLFFLLGRKRRGGR